MNKTKAPVVLTVDDDASINILYQYYLKTVFNGKVVSASDGFEAIQKFQEYDPSFIIMDIHMPNMNGLTATKQIRDINKKVPIIIVSATASIDYDSGIESGADEVVTKPFSIEVFQELFEKHYFTHHTNHNFI